MAGPPRTLWRKASPRKATDESLLAACLPRHRPFAYPVCVAARKPRFRSGNLPRHVRSGTSVCVAARKPRFRSGNLPRHVQIGTSVCVVARKPRFRSGNPLRHVRIGTSVCVVASGDDHSSSTAVLRTGHCQKDDHRRNGHQARVTFTAGETATRLGEHSPPERRPPGAGNIHCRKYCLQQIDYRKDNPRMRLWASKITLECVYGHQR